MRLILVESPTKAITFNKFLDAKKYHVEATIGHIRDLPENKIGIDTEHDFKPVYVPNKDKKDIIKKITSLAKKADEIILATDADREGEAISYHIGFLLGYIDEGWPDSKVLKGKSLKRIVFHEITESALKEALESPRDLNFDLINAQQTRRILDRLVGYKLSPLLWKKIGKRWLSAGRVQTVALRFIVEREKEIKKFESNSFYKGQGGFAEPGSKTTAIQARLVSKGTEKYEKKTTIALFDGDYTYSQTTITAENVKDLQKDIESDSFTVTAVDVKTSSRSPLPPYITSTLQQDAARKFGYSSKQTMRLAQNLYEHGLITYHRTDSTFLSTKFLDASKDYILKTYGKDYYTDKARMYKTTSKGAQEAHEAIRPTQLNPEMSGPDVLTNRHKNVYELIFRRAVASQMADAQIRSMSVTIEGKKGYLFKADENEIAFDGFLRLYPSQEYKGISFKITQGSPVDLSKIEFTETATQPPPRYSEASLIRTLEKRGIGRPSTYAPIISTIEARNYVEKNEGRFSPTMLGTAVCDYMSSAFKDIFSIEFTSEMEQKLDDIADHSADMIKTLKTFYDSMSPNIEREAKSDTHIDVQEKTDEICPECKSPLVIRFSKFGKFFACSNYPECKFTKNFVLKADKPCPKCGGDILIKFTKTKKKFYGCANYPNCDFAAWKLQDIDKTTTA